jgi:tRNA A37 threonylcarbamoyladenosine synthetase subunit TsaC/SUA5/YrdC
MDVSLDQSVAWVAQGGVLAFPTETSGGLGADARSDARRSTGCASSGPRRRADLDPLTGVAALAALGFRVGAAAAVACDFWPGPPRSCCRVRARSRAASRADGARSACARRTRWRAPAQRCASAGIGPLTATSCNASGAPPARTRADARAVCGGDPRVRVIAEGEEAGGEAASTVVDVTGARPRVLRWGALGESALQPVLAELAA